MGVGVVEVVRGSTAYHYVTTCGVFERRLRLAERRFLAAAAALIQLDYAAAWLHHHNLSRLLNCEELLLRVLRRNDLALMSI